jgi:hypothetical protein
MIHSPSLCLCALVAELLELKKEELERLVACIRDRVDRIIQIKTI